MSHRKIVVNYDFIEETHDCYYSDPYDEKVSEDNVSKIYPLLRIFSNDDIINRGAILCSSFIT